MNKIVRLLLLCILTFVGVETLAATSQAPPTVLITGANRGIGLALAAEYASKGWRVIASCRDPAHAEELAVLAAKHPEVAVESLDVNDAAAVQTLARKYRDMPIDVLINNAGILGEGEAQALSNFDAATFDQVMRVNSYAPLRVSAAFLDSVALSKQRKIIAVTSLAGSIASARQPHAHYFYNMSKSALNMGMRLLQNDVRERGVIVGLISPGPVDTDMNRQYRGGTAAGPGLLSPTQSAVAIVAFIEKLRPEMGGRFFEYNGQENPW